MKATMWLSLASEYKPVYKRAGFAARCCLKKRMGQDSNECDNPWGNGVSAGGCEAKTEAIDAPATCLEPELQAVVDGWPSLSAEVKAGILAMVRAAGG